MWRASDFLPPLFAAALGAATAVLVHVSGLTDPVVLPTVITVDSANTLALQPGQEVEVWVKRVVPGKQRVELTMIEPLPLEWREISKDMVLKGKVVRLERFGAFVEIGAERPGLVHISEIAHGYIKSPDEVIKEGDEVEVKVLSVNRRRKQIKLSMKALEVDPRDVSKPQPKKSQAVEEEPEVDEPVPTAMEMALRDAMERNKTEAESPSQTTSPKSKQNGEKFDDIMSRTLEQRPNSTS